MSRLGRCDTLLDRVVFEGPSGPYLERRFTTLARNPSAPVGEYALFKVFSFSVVPCAGVVFLALGLAAPSLGQSEQAAPVEGLTTASGIYTEEQADAAESVYARACASCHGDKLQGSGNAPPLSGFPFTSYWTGKPLSELMAALHRMPADNPGSLTEKQYANLLAQILETNTFPAGDTELPADEAALAEITFAAPAK
ncbi:c-type cytochrome [Devosia naphthalenivorans]|uniref:c-type cytochrome n=1 Tax=Devosia naphthalenivorans TaxID=2082392 RepID=UPI0013B0647B|nr:cytochrome c [Devosia naphthalenivorans]